VHYYFKFWDPPKHLLVHDHHWLFSRLFMSLLQRNHDKNLGQTRPMGKLQALVFHPHSHTKVDDFIHALNFSIWSEACSYEWNPKPLNFSDWWLSHLRGSHLKSKEFCNWNCGKTKKVTTKFSMFVYYFLVIVLCDETLTKAMCIVKVRTINWTLLIVEVCCMQSSTYWIGTTKM
jgi:hypothetical protein